MKDLTGTEIAEILRDIANQVDGLPANRVFMEGTFSKGIVEDGVDKKGYVTHRDSGGRTYEIIVNILPDGVTREKMELAS